MSRSVSCSRSARRGRRPLFSPAGNPDANGHRDEYCHDHADPDEHPTKTPIPTNTPVGSPTSPPPPTATSTPLGGGSGKYTLNSDCNPWAGPGQCPAPASDTGQLCSRRVIVVPIIDAFGNGKTDFEVQGFALMYLIGYANGSKCQGNDCQIQGIFVDADVSVNAISCSNGAPATCVFDPDSSIQFERLVE